MRRRLAAALSVILGLSFAVAVPAAASAEPIEVPPVVINEIQPDDPQDAADWVELANTGQADVDLAGWKLRDDKNESTIASGYVVPAGGYLVLSKDAGFSFGLGKSGDEVHLLLPDGTVVDEYAFTELPPRCVERLLGPVPRPDRRLRTHCSPDPGRGELLRTRSRDLSCDQRGRIRRRRPGRLDRTGEHVLPSRRRKRAHPARQRRHPHLHDPDGNHHPRLRLRRLRRGCGAVRLRPRQGGLGAPVRR